MKHDSSSPSSYLFQVYPRGGRLPEGIQVDLDPSRGDLLRHEPFTLILRHTIFSPTSEGRLLEHEPTTLIWRETLADGKQVVIKLYRQRLAVRYRSLAIGFRVRREFDGLSQLETLGIPCTAPLFWSHGRFGPFGWSEILATEWVVQSQSLRNLLITQPEASRALDLSPLFADVARMHAAGLQHGWLRTRNVLVSNLSEKPVFVFIDMPRFQRFPRDIRNTRMAYYDLMFFCQGLARYFPREKFLLWLSAYGIPESEAKDFIVRLRRFRSTGFLRSRLGAEFKLRMAMARLLGGRRDGDTNRGNLSIC